MTTAGSPLTRAADSYRAVQDSVTVMHETGTFVNRRNEQCTATLELHVTSPTDHEYAVRTERKFLARNGGKTLHTVESSVETFHSMKAATREFNWSLYVLEAVESEVESMRIEA